MEKPQRISEMLVGLRERKWRYPVGVDTYVENLSCYRRNFHWHGIATSVEHLGVEFDIERIFRVKNGAAEVVGYSSMANAYTAFNRLQDALLSRKAFESQIGRVSGFELEPGHEEDQRKLLQYSNPGANVLSNWRFVLEQAEPFVCVGVVQRELLPDVGKVTGDVVPYLAALFNKLNPDHVIDDATVLKSVWTAWQSDRIPPRP